MSRLWLTHPVRSAQEVMEYRESRVGIPFIITTFMFCAAQSAWLIGAIGITSIAFFGPVGKAIAAIGLYIWYFAVWNITTVLPRYAFFTPLGFRAFRWLITQ